MEIGPAKHRKYWRIGTGSEKLNYWDLMLSQSKICVGWSTTGDLKKADVRTKSALEALLKNSKDRPARNSTLSAKALELFNFYTGIKTGDVILAQRGAAILGIGIVTSDYYFNEVDNYSHQRKVEWKLTVELQPFIGGIYKAKEFYLIWGIFHSPNPLEPTYNCGAFGTIIIGRASL